MMKEDWVEVELGEVCKYSKGKKPKTFKKEFSEEVPFPYINIKAFEKGIFDEYTDGIKCNLCEDGDLLMVWDGARAGFTGKAKKGVIGSTLMKIEPKVGIEKNYLFYFLLSLYRKLNTNPRGVGIPHVEPRLLWLSNLILPPLPIQRSIVSKIETLFSDLDKGIADLKKAQEQLKIYRQAVLKKAFEGELTRNKIEDDASINQNMKKNRGFSNLPESWKCVKFGDIAEMCLGKMLDKRKNKGESKPYLGNINVRWGNFDLTNLKKMKIEATEEKRYRIVKNDLIICEGGEPGRCAVWMSDKVMYIQKALHRVRVSSGNNPFYLYYYLKYLSQTDGLSSFFTGTTIKHLTGRRLKEVIIPLAPLQEQHQIVREIESRLSVCDKVEQNISEALEKSEALRQSILKKAFEGKLLSTAEIEACRREADYEPASVLLERIRKERPSGK